MKTVSIIIPHYNRCDLLGKCLHHLSEQDFGDFEVLVIDNGSTDNSEQIIKGFNFPFSLHWERLNENRGFAYAVNVGILKSKSPYIMLLNNDVWLTRECLGRMVFLLSNSDSISVAGCRIMSAYDPDVIDSVGAGISKECKCFQVGWSSRWSVVGDNLLKMGRTLPVFGATGACVLFRREVFDRVGFFDEHFFMYLEDMDWAIRARAKGIKVAIALDAVAYHLGSGSTGGSYSDFSLFWIVRNQLFLIFKNIPLSFVLRNFLYILLGQMKTLGKAVILLKKPGIYFKALGSFVRMLPTVYALRKATERMSCNELNEWIEVSGYLRRLLSSVRK